MGKKSNVKLMPIVIGKVFMHLKNDSILLPSKQRLFKERGDAEGRKRGVFFEC